MDYKKVQDLELKRYKRVDAPILEAICYALRIHPIELSADYAPPMIPRLSHVAVDGRKVAAHLEAEGMSAPELAKRAGISHNYVYNVARYDQQTLPADVARKVAKAMGLRGSELAPALGIYQGPDGEEMYGDLLGEYGGPTPYDISALPALSNI